MPKQPKHEDHHEESIFDSTKHLEERKASIRAENQQNAQVAKEAAEDQEIADFRGLPQEGESREQLLDRIRKLREKPQAVETEGFRSEGLMKEFTAEQEAGRAAVAKATAEVERNRAANQQAEAEGGKK